MTVIDHKVASCTCTRITPKTKRTMGGHLDMDGVLCYSIRYQNLRRSCRPFHSHCHRHHSTLVEVDHTNATVCARFL